MVLLKIALMFCLAYICYQDLVYRAVYWLCFPGLAILMFILKYRFSGLEETLIHAGYGLVFLSPQLFMLWLYFSIKNKKLINLTGDYLGWSDILFLAAISFYLSPGNYIVFYLLSLMVVLIYTFTGALLSSKERNLHIPLAGLQGALLGLLMLVEGITTK